MQMRFALTLGNSGDCLGKNDAVILTRGLLQIFEDQCSMSAELAVMMALNLKQISNYFHLIKMSRIFELRGESRPIPSFMINWSVSHFLNLISVLRQEQKFRIRILPEVRFGSQSPIGT